MHVIIMKYENISNSFIHKIMMLYKYLCSKVNTDMKYYVSAPYVRYSKNAKDDKIAS